MITTNIIKSELEKYADKKYKNNYQRFFKNTIKLIGVSTPQTRKLAKQFFIEIDSLEKKKLFKLCNQLLKTKYFEMGIIAFIFLQRHSKNLEKSDFKILTNFIKQYIYNWAWCDDFCTHLISNMIKKYPELIPELKIWTKSPNLWVRRASAISLIPFTRQGKYHKEAFKIATTLLNDREDLVQKGYGWLLKETSNSNQQAVFDFVIKYKHKMPRTALRYAIEKMPKELREIAMKK